ncbi:transglutaminase domain-containing protein [Methanobrevibacter sp.]|uniref:transglutaminase domain-containing protein n=1 Tax=Methanobrevibacter sp. TaxID=66852 RepID=UPI0025F2C2B7|nr:transglutaminase domain-containing protein [Methanobrevibacter sp.]MBR4447970.1 hypothetical protein [Methanobrevibacter sp.]
MNKKILLALAVVLIVALSVGTIYASDVNEIDSYISQQNEDIAQDAIGQSEGQILGDTQDQIIYASEDDTYESSVDNDASDDVLKSEISSTLSTNMDNEVLSSDNQPVSSNTVKTITAKDVTKYYKGNAKYTATFVNLNGNPLANTNVKIVVKGVTHNVKTDSKGVASLDIDLKPGTYMIKATNPVNGYSLTTTFKVLSTITANDVSKVVSDSRKFTAKFLKKNGKPLAKKKIKFKIDGQTYQVKTNKNGVASLSLTSLTKGTYKIISYNKDGLKQTNKVKVYKSAKTSLTPKTYIFLKGDTKKIKVKLLNAFGYAPGKGQIINFKVDGKKYTASTNKKGIAKIKLQSINPGTYTVKYKFASTAFYKASSAKSKLYVLPSKTPTFTVKSTTTFGQGAGTPFKVALTSGNVPIVNKQVTISLKGTKYTLTTDNNGIVSLPINVAIGTYTISYTNKAFSKLDSKTGSTTINVIKRAPTSIKWSSATSFNQGTQTCQLLVLDSNNKPISGGTVKLTVDSKDYTATTSSTGYATFKVSFAVGSHTVSYSYNGNNLNAPSSGKTTLQAKKITSISINNIVKAANTVKNYYQNNKKLPSSVTSGGVTLTMPEFLYVLSETIVQLGNSNTKDVSIISGVKAPASPSGDNINSKQLTKENYLKWAKNIADYIKNHKQAPNYASSAVGKVIYTELVDATARIVAFYGNNNNLLPAYVVINTASGGSSSTQSGINEKNTISQSDLAAYLKKTTHCEVGNSQIKSKVTSLTKGLTTDSAKANAIYNFVRDKISYSFYYDTKHGAVGTLNAGSGNCVDQAHLLIAMFRTAGLHARYVHGTCTFSSGSTYGHVWAQVLIGNTWTVADPTSTRNSFGKVVNWNTNSYTLHGKYAEILF